MLWVVASLAGAVPAVAEETQSVLLPGLDLRDADLSVGAWCRYLVVDEAMGERDSSSVYIAVVGREKNAESDSYWLEIETAPEGTREADRDVYRLLIDGAVRSMAPDDSLSRYVRRIYIKKGRGEVREGDPNDLARLTIVSPTSDKDWTVVPATTIDTPAGTFSCDMRRFESDVTREIPTGHVKLVQRRVDRVRVWISPRVPIFHLVQCEIERVRESRTIPRVRGIPDAGPRESRTTSILVGSGTGARSLLSSP